MTFDAFANAAIAQVAQEQVAHDQMIARLATAHIDLEILSAHIAMMYAEETAYQTDDKHSAEHISRVVADVAHDLVRENNPCVTLPAMQLDAGYKLARTYGHAWGQFTPRALQLRKDAWFLADANTFVIEAVTRAYHRLTDTLMTGDVRLAPVVDDTGDIVYTTTGQRLTWRVAPSGDVTATVNRPQGAVLTISVPADRAVPVVVARDASIACNERHLSAAANLIGALRGPVGAMWALKDVAFDPDEVEATA